MILKKHILAALAYFDLFDYPLTAAEIYSFLGCLSNRNEFTNELHELSEEGIIYKLNEFYSLKHDFLLADKRIRGNRKAEGMLVKAGKAAAIIAAFPYVKGVGVSGSLSKNFADDTADIDFFIITAANRLWIARTLLHVFKKITYLFSMQHSFCMNYFIDEAEPVILEKNIYTATELVTLIPFYGKKAFNELFDANGWAKNKLPNNIRNDAAREIQSSWVRIIIEKIFNNRLGNLLDDYLMRLTSRSWRSKTKRGKRNHKGMILNLHTGKHFSKPNPENFQTKLLLRYEKKLVSLNSLLQLKESHLFLKEII